MTLLDRVTRLLTDCQVSHALIGAAALAARGLARSTFDIDLLTADRRVLDRALWTPLEADGVAIDIRTGDPADPLGGVVRLTADGERPVDLILGRHGWQARAVSRADRLPDGPPVVTAADLILLKLYAGGTQDLWDVRALLELSESDGLAAEVTAALSEHPGAMQHRWAEARRVG